MVAGYVLQTKSAGPHVQPLARNQGRRQAPKQFTYRRAYALLPVSLRLLNS
jgi:hypothetical protein